MNNIDYKVIEAARLQIYKELQPVLYGKNTGDVASVVAHMFADMAIHSGMSKLGFDNFIDEMKLAYDEVLKEDDWEGRMTKEDMNACAIILIGGSLIIHLILHLLKWLNQTEWFKKIIFLLPIKTMRESELFGCAILKMRLSSLIF